MSGRKNQKLRKNFWSTRQILNLTSVIQFDDLKNIREDDQSFFQTGKHFYGFDLPYSEESKVLHLVEKETRYEIGIQEAEACGVVENENRRLKLMDDF